MSSTPRASGVPGRSLNLARTYSYCSVAKSFYRHVSYSSPLVDFSPSPALEFQQRQPSEA